MILNNHDIPGEHSIECRIPILTIGVEDTIAVGVAPFDCTVTKVEVLHDAAITGADTNYFTDSLFDGGADGTGTTVIASKAYVDSVDGAILNDTLTLSGTAANLNIDEGDKFIFDQAKTGNGMEDPAKMVRITFKAR